MVSEPFLWLSGSCGHLRRSSAALAFIQSSLSEASHCRHTHSTCNTRISTFCVFNCQRKGIERQNSQSRAKPNQERSETASHVPPRAGWSFDLTSTCSTCRHAPSVLATRLTRQSTLIHAPHVLAASISDRKDDPIRVLLYQLCHLIGGDSRKRQVERIHAIFSNNFDNCFFIPCLDLIS